MKTVLVAFDNSFNLHSLFGYDKDFRHPGGKSKNYFDSALKLVCKELKGNNFSWVILEREDFDLLNDQEFITMQKLSNPQATDVKIFAYADYDIIQKAWTSVNEKYGSSFDRETAKLYRKDLKQSLSQAFTVDSANATSKDFREIYKVGQLVRWHYNQAFSGGVSIYALAKIVKVTKTTIKVNVLLPDNNLPFSYGLTQDVGPVIERLTKKAKNCEVTGWPYKDEDMLINFDLTFNYQGNESLFVETGAIKTLSKKDGIKLFNVNTGFFTYSYRYDAFRD